MRNTGKAAGSSGLLRTTPPPRRPRRPSRTRAGEASTGLAGCGPGRVRPFLGRASRRLPPRAGTHLDGTALRGTSGAAGGGAGAPRGTEEGRRPRGPTALRAAQPHPPPTRAPRNPAILARAAALREAPPLPVAPPL